jgi:hypothetical protein
MKVKKVLLTALSLALFYLFYIFINNPGYHFTTRTCGHEFFLRRPSYDLMIVCEEDQIRKITDSQKVVNKLLLTDLIRELHISN